MDSTAQRELVSHSNKTMTYDLKSVQHWVVAKLRRRTHLFIGPLSISGINERLQDVNSQRLEGRRIMKYICLGYIERDGG
jgi:hypothetical protein